MTIDFQSSPPPYVANYGFDANEPAWYDFTFPNGRAANVSLSRWPFRFDVEYDGAEGMFTATALTSEQVEAKLTAIAELPATEAGENR